MNALLRTIIVACVAAGAAAAAEPAAAENEAAAYTTLRSAIFPAQIQFQAGGYRDADGDYRGDYSSDLRDLAGGPIPGLQATLSLLPPAFNAERPAMRGYAFATHGFGEEGFVAYAWPERPGETGTLVFAILVNGLVWSKPAPAGEAAAPGAWDLWGGIRPGTPLQEPGPPWVKHHPPGVKAPGGRPRKSMADNLRQIALACAVYVNDEQEYPPDLQTLVKSSGGDLPERRLRSQKAPDRPDAFLYVRPAPNGGSTQPLVIEDPACWGDRGCHVVFCDGHTGWITSGAPKLWAEAKRLAALPKAAITGIAPDDWKAVQKLLDAAKPAKTEPPAAGPPDPDGVPDPDF